MFAPIFAIRHMANVFERGGGFGKIYIETPDISVNCWADKETRTEGILSEIEKGIEMSTMTDIGKELFKNTKTSKFIFEDNCEFTTRTDLDNNTVFVRTNVLDYERLHRHFTRIDIHTQVHLLQYSSDTLLSIEKLFSNRYPKFIRSRKLEFPNFAHRFYSEVYAHYIERLHFHQLSSLSNDFPNYKWSRLYELFEEDKSGENVLLTLINDIMRKRYKLGIASNIYREGYVSSKKSIYDAQLDEAKNILMNFDKLAYITDDYPREPNKPSGRYMADDISFCPIYDDYMEPEFFDTMSSEIEH
jgi:hypothetical protein